MLTLKKKDKVLVIAGDDKGKTGEVLKVFPKEMKAIVSKINILKKHRRPTRIEPGGIVNIEGKIHISNLQLICPKCNQPTKPKFDFLSDGQKIRICRRCNEMIL